MQIKPTKTNFNLNVLPKITDSANHLHPGGVLAWQLNKGITTSHELVFRVNASVRFYLDELQITDIQIFDCVMHKYSKNNYVSYPHKA